MGRGDLQVLERGVGRELAAWRSRRRGRSTPPRRGRARGPARACSSRRSLRRRCSTGRCRACVRSGVRMPCVGERRLVAGGVDLAAPRRAASSSRVRSTWSGMPSPSAGCRRSGGASSVLSTQWMQKSVPGTRLARPQSFSAGARSRRTVGVVAAVGRAGEQRSARSAVLGRGARASWTRRSRSSSVRSRPSGEPPAGLRSERSSPVARLPRRRAASARRGRRRARRAGRPTDRRVGRPACDGRRGPAPRAVSADTVQQAGKTVLGARWIPRSRRRRRRRVGRRRAVRLRIGQRRRVPPPTTVDRRPQEVKRRRTVVTLPRIVACVPSIGS